MGQASALGAAMLAKRDCRGQTAVQQHSDGGNVDAPRYAAARRRRRIDADAIRLSTWSLMPQTRFPYDTPLASVLSALERDAIESAWRRHPGAAVEIGLQPGAAVERLGRCLFRLGMNAEGSEFTGALRARLPWLPFLDHSLSFVLLSHALERATDPWALLDEAVRVLAPGGCLMAIGFNPWGWVGLRQRGGPGRLHASRSVSQQLRTRGLDEIRCQHLACWPPLPSAWLLRWQHPLERLGQRWWPTLSSLYCVTAVKTTYAGHAASAGFRVPLRGQLPAAEGMGRHGQ